MTDYPNTTDLPVVKCATDECENRTSLHLCDDCTEAQLGAYENATERRYYRD